MRTLAWLALPMMSLLATTSARADDGAAAAALFKEGREALKRGDYAVACARLGESLRLDPAAAGTALNLAECEEHTGKLASAWQHFTLAAEKLAPGDDRKPLIKARLTALEPRLPRLSIRLAPGAPAGAKVVHNAVELGAGSLETPLPVDPGDHVVEVTAPGRMPQRFTLSIAAGETRQIDVTAGAPVSDEAPAAAAPGTSPLRIAGFVSAGVAAAGLGAAIATGVVAMQKKSVVDANCNPAPVSTCNQTGFDAAQTGKTLIAANAASWAIAAVAAGAGITLIVLGRSPAEKKAARLFVTVRTSGGELGGSF
jgi:hypothetical protein